MIFNIFVSWNEKCYFHTVKKLKNLFLRNLTVFMFPRLGPFLLRPHKSSAYQWLSGLHKQLARLQQRPSHQRGSSCGRLMVKRRALWRKSPAEEMQLLLVVVLLQQLAQPREAVFLGGRWSPHEKLPHFPLLLAEGKLGAVPFPCLDGAKPTPPLF